MLVPHCFRGGSTLCIVLLLLHTRPVDPADMGGRVTSLWLLIVPALVEDLRQVGSVDLPELLIVIQSCTEVPVFTCRHVNTIINTRFSVIQVTLTIAVKTIGN